MSTTVMAAPERLVYGAKELKEFIRQNTYRSFAIALAFLLLLFIGVWVYNFFKERAMSLKMNAPVVKLKLTDLPPPPSNSDAPPPPPPPTNMIVQASGPASVAGNPVPVPETMLAPDAKEFASTNEISRATSVGGSGEDFGGIGDGGDGPVEITGNTQVQKEEEPAADEFVAVEKEPSTDIGDLQKRVVYPEMAKRANIEGKVVVRVLVGKDGRPRKFQIDDSDSQLLDKAASDAVMKSVFTPAIQNGSPIDCWVSVPVTFKLR